MTIDEGVFDNIADRAFDLMKKNASELKAVYDEEGKLSLTFSVKVEDKGGLPKITVGLKSKIKEVSDSSSGIFDPRQEELDLCGKGK